MSNSGLAALRRVFDREAGTPVSTARRTLSATPAASDAKPFRSRVHRHIGAATISRRCGKRHVARDSMSGWARDQANPEAGCGEGFETEALEIGVAAMSQGWE